MQRRIFREMRLLYRPLVWTAVEREVVCFILVMLWQAATELEAEQEFIQEVGGNIADLTGRLHVYKHLRGTPALVGPGPVAPPPVAQVVLSLPSLSSRRPFLLPSAACSPTELFFSCHPLALPSATSLALSPFFCNQIRVLPWRSASPTYLLAAGRQVRAVSCCNGPS